MPDVLHITWARFVSVTEQDLRNRDKMLQVWYHIGWDIALSSVWHIDGLVLERRNSSALELDLRLSCIDQAIDMPSTLNMSTIDPLKKEAVSVLFVHYCFNLPSTV